jgi:uncharacterized protein YjiS (DUF1127 family)
MTHLLVISNYLKNPIEGLISLVKEFIRVREENKNIRLAIKELSSLSDRELNDIGISRGDILAVASGDISYQRNRLNYHKG